MNAVYLKILRLLMIIGCYQFKYVELCWNQVLNGYEPLKKIQKGFLGQTEGMWWNILGGS